MQDEPDLRRIISRFLRLAVDLLLRHGDRDRIRRRIVGNAVRTAVHFGDRISVDTRIVIGDLLKERRRIRLRGDGRRFLRHRHIFTVSRQFEGEGLRRPPVVDLLRDRKAHGDGARLVGWLVLKMQLRNVRRHRSILRIDREGHIHRINGRLDLVVRLLD